jgi:hypothetical protein
VICPAPNLEYRDGNNTSWQIGLNKVLFVKGCVVCSSHRVKLVVHFPCSESEILHHEKQHEPFYSSFVALSTHYITTVCSLSKYATLITPVWGLLNRGFVYPLVKISEQVVNEVCIYPRVETAVCLLWGAPATPFSRPAEWALKTASFITIKSASFPF